MVTVVFGHIIDKYLELKDATFKTDTYNCKTEQSNILYIRNIDKKMKVNGLNIQIKGCICEKSSRNKVKVDAHFVYMHLVFNSYVVDENDIPFETQIFHVLKCFGGIFASSAILVGASSMRLNADNCSL